MDIDLRDIEAIAGKILQLYRDELDRKGINASHSLSNSASTTVEINDTKLLISLNLEPYWQYVEYGRRPGKRPPMDVIEEWINVKPIIPEPVNNKIPDTRQLAYLIARKIGRDGIEGRKPLTNVMYSDAAESMIDDIKSVIAKQLKQQFIDGVSL